MAASSEILAALADSYGSASSKAFVAALTEGEGGISWRTLYGAGTLLPPTESVQVTAAGRTWTGSLDAFPNWGGARLKSGSKTTASGAAQFEPASWDAAGRLSGRSDFSPQSQIQNIWDYAAQVFSLRSGGISLHNALTAGGNGLLLIPKYLFSIWPGGCDSGFPERFAGNLALTTTATAAAARKIGRGTAILP